MREAESVDTQSREVVLKQMEQYFGVFKHHWDLYMKANTLFLGVVAAIGGYIYRPEAASGQRYLLVALVVLASCAAVVGSFASYGWLVAFAKSIHALESRLGDVRFPFEGSLRVIALFGVAASIVLLAGIFQLAMFVKG